MIKLIDSSNLTNKQQNEGARIIKAFAAESALSKQKIRNENISSRKSDGIFFILRHSNTKTDPICQKFCKQLGQSRKLRNLVQPATKPRKMQS